MDVTAKLSGIFVGAEKGAGKGECASALLVAEHGVQGDIHAGSHPLRNVSLFAQEVVTAVQSEGFIVQPGALSANLFTENLDLDALALGTQFRIGAALLEIVERRKPCRSITRIDHRLTKRLVGHCGQFARVLVGSVINVGDEIELL